MLTTLIAMSLSQLPAFNPQRPVTDWLLTPTGKAGVYRKGNDEIVLANGLLSRTFTKIGPSLATTSLKNWSSGEEFVRTMKPEAVFVVDGKTIKVGGAQPAPNLAFLTQEFVDHAKADPDAMHFVGFEVGKPMARFPWKRVRHAENRPWPPPGVSLALNFEGKGLKASVHYEMYDGIPLLSKWVQLTNESGAPVRVEKFMAENIAFVESESVVDNNPSWSLPNVTSMADYAFGGMAPHASNQTAYWMPDPSYKTQVNYELKTPCDLEVRPPFGPDQIIAPGESFTTFRTFLLVHENWDRERRGLALRRTYRTIAPWITENPIMLHLTSTDPKVVYPAIDQAAECGFEMIVISFWSGLDMEDVSPANLQKFKEFREYANKKGVELGGYSLLASRSIDAKNDVVNPKPMFGHSPCLESEWGQTYFGKIKTFIDEAGFQLLEHDGNYPGDTCASTNHPGHRGFDDSQWNQYRRISEFYKLCRSKGVFLNVPDNYFLVGSNKTGMGYRESNWSLPRAQQHIHARQNLFDGTWEKTPTMGWMMTPLVEYQGGGKEATIEPLKEHLHDYQMHLANNFGFGAQSCYRGPRLYDAPETKAAVIKWVQWFKMHRAILESDVVHLRRANGRDIDGVLHVNPTLDTPGMALFYNPINEAQSERFRIPLFFTGLKGSCRVTIQDSAGRIKNLSRQKLDGTELELTISVPPHGCVWVEFRR